MDFNTVYAQKLTTADRVAALVKDDDWVDYGWAIGTCPADAALASACRSCTGLNSAAASCAMCRKSSRLKIEAEHFCWNSWHMGGIERKAVAAGYAYYSPLRYSELPRYYPRKPRPAEHCGVCGCPMDSHGYFNLGPCASHRPMLPQGRQGVCGSEQEHAGLHGRLRQLPAHFPG